MPSDLVNQQVDNGQKKVPSVILTPVAIVKNNVNQVIEGGDVKASDVCKGTVQERMHRRGHLGAGTASRR